MVQLQRRDLLLAAARVACTALAVASFESASVPFSRSGDAGLQIFQVLKVTTIMQVGWGVMTTVHHVSCVCHWPGMAPDAYYHYIMVTAQWLMTALHVGVASSAAFIIFFLHYNLHVCGSYFMSRICWAYEVSSLLACAMGLLSVIISLTLNWARLRHDHGH